jgi:hypothetical protein
LGQTARLVFQSDLDAGRRMTDGKNTVFKFGIKVSAWIATVPVSVVPKLCTIWQVPAKWAPL